MKLRLPKMTWSIAAVLLMAVALPANVLAEEPTTNPLSRASVLRDADIPTIGNPEGDITIVEYFDYRCPYCKAVNPVLMKVAKEDGKVRIVAKDWPIFGGSSIYAARMVLAAKYQNKYAQAHDALIAAKTSLSEESVRAILAAAGVDVAQATSDLDTHHETVDGILARNKAQAEAFDFQGTPGFIVGTFRIPMVLSAAEFKHAIADARSAAATQK